MAGSSTREGSPEERSPAGISSAVTTFPAIVLLLAVGLALRFIIAYVLLPGSGFPNDLASFQGWGNDIALHGPTGFYDRAGFLDYPPVYLILLGIVSRFAGGDLGEWVKVMPILSDLGLAAIVWYMVLEMGGSSRRALVAAAIVVVNPITWFNSAIWGQADAVGSIFLLLGLRELQKDRRETASVLAVLAVLTKMQLGILGVVVGCVVLRRSLVPKTGVAQPDRVLSSIGAGLMTAAAVCLPFTGLSYDIGRLHDAAGLLTIAVGIVAGIGVFALCRRYLPLAGARDRSVAAVVAGAGTVVLIAGMVFDSIVSRLMSTFGEYPYLTLNAYNPWALVGRSGEAMGRSLSWIRDANYTSADTGVTEPGFVFGPFPPALVLGALVLALVLVVGAVALWKSSRRAADEDGGNRASERRDLAAVMAVSAAVIAVFAVATVNGLAAAVLGDGMLIAILAGVALWAAWRDDALSLLVALAILAIAFFVVPTRVHERYLFPFFALGTILLAVSWRWTVTYLALTVVNTLNLLAVLVQYDGLSKPDAANSPLITASFPDMSRQLAGTLTDWGRGIVSARWGFNIGPIGWEGIWPIVLSALVTGTVMIWVLLQMRGVAVDKLASEAATAGLESGSGWLDRIFGAFAGVEGAHTPSTRGLAAAPGDGVSVASVHEGEEHGMDSEYEDRDELPLGDEQPNDGRPLYVPDFVMSIWHRLYRPSALPDRSPSLNSEPRGRLDKLDLWVVAALIIIIASMRIYRLGEPVDMHFDEVYHARTAMEFLQDWKYGLRHDTYEWTHPHFAKYAIAASINTFSDDKVTSTGNIDVPVKDVLVQPRQAYPPSAPDPNTAEKNADPDLRYGDRTFVATGSDVRVYDLTTRALVHTYPIPGASAFSSVGITGLVYVGTTDGRIYRIDTNSLDDVRLGTSQTVPAPVLLGVKTGISISRIYTDTPPYALVSDTAGDIVSVDLTNTDGAVVGRGNLPGAADFAPLGAGPTTVIANPKQVTDATAVAQVLASDVPGAGQAEIQAALTESVGDLEIALPLGPLSTSQVTLIKNQITAGALPGLSISSSSPQVLVAYQSGVGLLDARHVVVNSSIPTSDPATSLAVNTDTQGEVFVASGASIVILTTDPSGGPATATKSGNQPLERMPGLITKIVFDKGTKIAHALGRTQDGQSWTVYAIATEGAPDANAVFSDARLPFQPVALGLDSSPKLPNANHEALLAFAADGSTASIDVGQFAFSWRVVGVLFGILMAVCMYLLTRLLFRRRTVGLLVALFTLTDGMLFVQSRIAMNDTYVGGLLLLAYVIFAVLWLNKWRSPRMAWAAFWIGMPILGVVLGLALSAKWVAAYAMVSIAVLILIRSALGRVLTVGGLAAITGLLGYQGIAEMKTMPDTGNVPLSILAFAGALAVAVAGGVWLMRTRTTPDKVAVGLVTALGAALLVLAGLFNSPASMQNGAPNYTFFLIALAITVLAAAGCAYRPVAWTREEFWFATAGPIIAGAGILALGGLMHATNGSMGLITLPSELAGQWSSFLVKAGAAGIGLGVVAVPVFWGIGRYGFGPLAVAPGPRNPARFAEPASPAPAGWLRLGSGKGLPALWMTLCLAILPFVVYILMYIPWAMPWHQETDQTGSLPAIACLHTSVTTDTDGIVHAVCDNAWPAGHTGQNLWELTISMYNYHNDLRASHAASSPWWAWPMDLKPVWFESDGYSYDLGSWIHDGGNPALWWMAIFGVAFITWQAYRRRSLGLALITMAFFWQWLSWARIDRAAFQYHFYTALPFFLMALAYFLAELWHGPSRRTWLLARCAAAVALIFPALMWLAKPVACSIARVDTSEYFGNSACGTSTGSVVLEARYVLIGALLVVAFVVMALTLVRLERRQSEGHEDRNWAFQLLATPLLALVPLVWLGQAGPRDVWFTGALPSETIAWVMLPLLAIIGFFALTARNPRRFVLGVCIFAVAAFLALYPDLSALPIPASIQGLYYAALPTWMYGFQFSVNLQPSSQVGLLTVNTVLTAGFVLFAAGIAAWVAWEHRIVVGFRRATRRLGPGAYADGDGPEEGGSAPEAPASSAGGDKQE